MWKQLLDVGVSVYVGVDASPHCGRNCETVVLAIMTHCLLMELIELVQMLGALSRASFFVNVCINMLQIWIKLIARQFVFDQQGGVDSLPEEPGLMYRMRQTLRFHTLLLATLGAG